MLLNDVEQQPTVPVRSSLPLPTCCTRQWRPLQRQLKHTRALAAAFSLSSNSLASVFRDALDGFFDEGSASSIFRLSLTPADSYMNRNVSYRHINWICRLVAEYRELCLVGGNNDGNNGGARIVAFNCFLKIVIFQRGYCENIANLRAPPPLPGVHIVVHSDRLALVDVVLLWNNK
jgi:hypothetical protein